MSIYTVTVEGRAPVTMPAETPLEAVMAWAQIAWPSGRETARVTAPDGGTHKFKIEQNPVIGGWDISEEEQG